MEVKKYYGKPGSSTNAIAIELILDARESILDIYFPNLHREGNQSNRDLNIDFLQRLFEGQFRSIERNGVRPSYRILLINDLELYANSVALVPSIDGHKVGLKENVLHIGIPGKLIPATCIACQPIFDWLERFFKFNGNIFKLAREKEKEEGTRLWGIGILLVFVLAVIFFLVHK
jgi:hypothetical protein